MMKKIGAALFAILLICGLFAGCQNTEVEPTVTGDSSTAPVDDKYSSESERENNVIEEEPENGPTEADAKVSISPQNTEKSNTPKETTPKETTPAAQKETSSPQTPAQTQKPSTSYQAIFDTYSAKIKAATPGIVQEYINESAGISDITTLAELSNAKVQKLAAISNDGIVEMAQLMYDTNGSYSEYESWAGKLTDVYMEEAAKITDAYMDSVM